MEINDLEKYEKNANAKYIDFISQTEKNIRRLDKFYTYLISLSGGAIVLSITFLNKVTKIDIPIFISNYHILYLSWLLLFLSIFFGLARTLQHIDYSHNARLSHWLGKQALFEEKQIEFYQGNNNQSLTDDFHESLNNLNKYGSKATRKEKTAQILTLIFEILSRQSFIFGIFFLIIFAVFSLN